MLVATPGEVKESRVLGIPVILEVHDAEEACLGNARASLQQSAVSNRQEEEAVVR
jgi:hypothetical protein